MPPGHDYSRRYIVAVMGTLIIVGIFFAGVFGYSDPEFPERVLFFVLLLTVSGVSGLTITRRVNKVTQLKNRKPLQRYYLAWNIFMSLLALGVSWILLGINKSVFGFIGPGALIFACGAFLYAIANRPPANSIPLWRVALRKPIDKYLTALFLWQIILVLGIIALFFRVFIPK